MITEATLDDIPRLCEMLGELFEEESDFAPDRTRQIAGLRLIIENPDHGRIFVMRCENTIAAMVNLLTITSTREGGVSLLLEDMIVHREFRGRGMATSLLRHAIRFARSIDAVQITLLTEPLNLRAIRLYERTGFVRSDATLMRMRLRDENGSEAD